MNEQYYHFTENEIGVEMWIYLKNTQDKIIDLTAIGRNDDGYYTWAVWGNACFDIHNRTETIRFIDLASNDGCSEGMFDTFEEAIDSTDNNEYFDTLYTYYIEED